jgi:hypothetical protein
VRQTFADVVIASCRAIYNSSAVRDASQMRFSWNVHVAFNIDTSLRIHTLADCCHASPALLSRRAFVSQHLVEQMRHHTHTQ